MAVGMLVLFLGFIVFFRDAVGSFVSSLGAAIGIPGGSVLFGFSPFFILELLLASLLWFGLVALVDYLIGVSWGDLTDQLKEDVFFLIVILVVLSVSGILTGFGLNFTGYRGGEGLLFVGAVATLRDIIRWGISFL